MATMTRSSYVVISVFSKIFLSRGDDWVPSSSLNVYFNRLTRIRRVVTLRSRQYYGRHGLVFVFFIYHNSTVMPFYQTPTSAFSRGSPGSAVWALW